MITTGNFVQYEKRTSKKDVHDWFNATDDEVFSNQEEPESLAETLCIYKDSVKKCYGSKADKKAYKNIYAHELIIMLPQNMDLESKHKFVNEYMYALDACYKSKYYLYAYRFYEQGEGSYVNILVFTRKIYKRKHSEMLVYDSDYYWNPKTKKRCKKGEDAVLLHKKGDPKLDDEGKYQFTEHLCSLKEKKVFKYTAFNRLINTLKKYVGYVKMKLLRNYDKRRLVSYIAVKDCSILSKRKLQLRNNMIKKINYELSKYADYFDPKRNVIHFDNYFYSDNKRLRKRFYTLLKRVDDLVHCNNYSDENKNIYIDMRLRQGFVSYKENLAALEDIVISIIEQWWADNILAYEI